MGFKKFKMTFKLKFVINRLFGEKLKGEFLETGSPLRRQVLCGRHNNRNFVYFCSYFYVVNAMSRWALEYIGGRNFCTTYSVVNAQTALHPAPGNNHGKKLLWS